MPKYDVDFGGKTYEVEAPDSRTAWQWAQSYALQNKPKTGYLAAAGKGIEQLGSGMRTGLGLAGDANQAALAGLERQKDIGQRYAEQTGLDLLKKAYEQQGVLGAIGEVGRQVPLAVAEQLPRMGATAAGARLGAMAGSPFGPAGAVVGGALGAFAPSMLEMGGTFAERQAREQQERGAPVDVSAGKAFAAAAPAAALDVAAQAIPLGRGMIAKLLGVPEQQLIKRSEAQVMKLAEERLRTTLAKGAGTSVLAEVPTEVGQAMIERLQAGLPLTTDDAMKEYAENAYGASLLAPLGAAGRYSERGGAREQVEQKQIEQRIAERAQAKLAEQQAAQQAEQQRAAQGQQQFAEQTGAPLLAGALPEEDQLGILGAQRNVPPPTVSAEEQQARATEIADQRRVLTSEVDSLKTQISQAAAAGDIAAVRALNPRLQQMSTALNEIEKQAKAAGVAPVKPSTLPAEDQAAATAETRLAALRKELVKAGDLGDFDKINKLTAKIAEVEDQMQAAKQQAFTQPDLFGGEMQQREAQQERAMAEAEADLAKRTQKAEPAEVQAQREISGIKADIATREGDPRTLRTLGLFGEDRDALIDAVNAGEITPLVKKTLGVGSAEELDDRIRELSAQPTKDEVDVTGPDGNLTKKGLKILQNQVALEQLRRLRENMQAAAAPQKDEELVGETVDKLTLAAKEKKATYPVRAVPDATPEQRDALIKRLLKQQERLLLQIVDAAREMAQAGVPTSRIQQSDRRVAAEKMQTARDQYLNLLVKQAAEERAQRGAAPLTEEELMRTLPAKSILDEMIQRSMALPSAAVTDPLATERQPTLETTPTNRPAEPGVFIQRAKDIQARMAAIYKTLNAGPLPQETKQRLREEDNRLVEELFALQEKFRGDPEFQQQVGYKQGKARDQRPLAQRPFRRPDAAIESLLADLEDARRGVVSDEVDRTPLQREAERIETALTRLEQRSSMRVGEQAGTTAYSKLATKRRLESRLAQINAILDAEPATPKRNVRKAGDIGLVKPTPESIAAKEQQAQPDVRARAADAITAALKDKDLSDADVKTLEEVRDFLNDRTEIENEGGKKFADLVLEELGSSKYADPTAMRAIRAQLAVEKKAREQVEPGAQKSLFPALDEKEIAVIRSTPLNFMKLLASKARKLVAERAALKEKLANAERLMQSFEQRKKKVQRDVRAALLDMQKDTVESISKQFERLRVASQTKLALIDDVIASNNAVEQLWAKLLQAKNNLAQETANAEQAQLVLTDTEADFRKQNEELANWEAEGGAGASFNPEKVIQAGVAAAEKKVEQLQKERAELAQLEKSTPYNKAIYDAFYNNEKATDEQKQEIERLKKLPRSVEEFQKAQLEHARNKVKEAKDKIAALKKEIARMDSMQLPQAIFQQNKLIKQLSSKWASTTDGSMSDDVLFSMRAATLRELKFLADEKLKLIQAAEKENLPWRNSLGNPAAAKARAEEAVKRITENAATEKRVKAERQAQQAMLERLSALPGIRVVSEAIYGRGGAQGLEEFERPTKRVTEKVGGPKPVSRVQPEERVQKKSVFIEHTVKDAKGKPVSRIIEIPVVPAVVKSGANIGRVIKGKWKPLRPLPPSLARKFNDLVTKEGDKAVAPAGSVEAALPQNKLAEVKQGLLQATKRAESALPSVTAKPGEKVAPPLRDLRSGTRAEEKLSTHIPSDIPIDFSGGQQGTIDFRVGEKSGGIDLDAAQARADKVKAPEGVKFKYFATKASLPKTILDGIEAQGVDIDTVRGGVLPDGTVFVVGENHTDMVDLEKTITHELVGHVGFEGFVGEKGMDTLLDKIPDVRGMAEKLGIPQAGISQTDKRAGDLQLLKEIIAYTEEARVDAGLMQKAGTFIKEMVGALRAALKKMGLVDASKMTTSDLFYLMRQSRANFNAGKPLAARNSDGSVSFRLGEGARYAKDVPAILTAKDSTLVGQKKRGWERVKANARAKDVPAIPTAKDSTLVGQKKRGWERVKANVRGLEFRTQFIDRAAVHEEIARRGLAEGLIDPVKAMDLTFFIRMHDQRNSFVAESATNGTLQLVKNDKGEVMVESKRGASLKQVSEALSKANVGNAEATNILFTKYLLAERALGKDGVGIDKLNYSKEFDPAELKAALEFGRGNEAFQTARGIYREYNNGLIDFAVQTGAISKQAAAAYTKGDYVPYYRVSKDGIVGLYIGGETPIRIGNIKEQPDLQSLVGGDEAVMDFFTSSLQNTAMLTDLSLRNLATRNVAFTLKELGIAERVGAGVKGKDIIHAKIDGEEQAWRIDTAAMEELFGDIPPELVVKGMEGIVTTFPAGLRLLGIPSNILRKFVTRDPRYAVRQVVRDSLTGLFISGANYKPVVSALGEMSKIASGKSTGENVLQSRGVIGGQVISGMPDDMQKIMQQIASGKKGWSYAMAKLDSIAMAGDAATRVNMYNSFLKQGLSEREATLATLESMNFSKRGVSPSMYMLNTLIPFFNAQIVGLDVLYKALTGKATMQEKLRVKQKLITRGLVMAGMTLAYAGMMDDDEAYENATPQQRYSNWFVRLPGIAEPLRVPIPFEIGFMFKALPEALYHMSKDDPKSQQAVAGLKSLAANSVPGLSSYMIPQAMKPALELALNKSIFTGQPIVSDKLARMTPEMQFDEKTSGLAKFLGETVGVSPKQVDHLVNGYFATLGISLLRLPDFVIGGAAVPQPTARVSDYPIIGGLFQPKDAGGVLQLAFQEAKANEQAMATFKALAESDPGKARAFLSQYVGQIAMASMAGTLRQNVGEINAAEAAVRASPNLSPDQKREALDRLRQIELALARQTVAVNRQVESRFASQ